MSSQTFLVLRGPLIILGAATCLLWPHMSKWSTTFILQLVLVFLGMVCFLYDIFHHLQCKFRKRVSQFLNEFVLDDFLRALYDPDTGIIPCSMASFVGAFSMYALRLDEAQKTKLIQSTLWTTEEEAHSILLSAGGTKALLPQAFQSWLIEGEEEKKATTTRIVHNDPKPNSVLVETVEESASDSSISECQNNMDDSPRSQEIGMEHRDMSSDEFNLRGKTEFKSGMGHDRPGMVFFNESQQTMPSEIPTDPLAIMFGILRDRTIDILRPWFAAIPESKLEILGTLATVGLCSQVVCRFRSSRSLAGSISAICLSGTALGAFSSVLLRQTVLGNIQDVQSAKQCMLTMLSRPLGRIKNLIMRNKWLHAAVALVLLSLCGKQRKIGMEARSRNF